MSIHSNMHRIEINIDKLIDIVNQGGTAKTGIDVFNNKGVLLLEKNVPIESIKPLLIIKNCGLSDVPVDVSNSGGIWDKSGRPLIVNNEKEKYENSLKKSFSENLDRKIKEINEKKEIAHEKYINAKKSIKSVISSIRNSGGEFEVEAVEDTVNDILTYLVQNETGFSYLSKEIFSYDDYLYNHSVNACTIGTAVLIRFNEKFGEIINNYLSTVSIEAVEGSFGSSTVSFILYQPEELHEIAMGYFLHDVGKVLIPDEVLNKKDRLTDKEFEIIRTHSYKKGVEILKKNKLTNPLINNTVGHHHSALFNDEKGCYPDNKHPIEIPPYVKICKLADIYDAMTSKRCYKEAFNPVGVVTELFRKYANKDKMLQFILRAFVKVIGVYPPGSVLYLKNGQMVYVLESEGPLVMPFTDSCGNTLKIKHDPVDLRDQTINNDEMGIDRLKPLKSPIEVYDVLPSYLKDAVQ